MSSWNWFNNRKEKPVIVHEFKLPVTSYEKYDIIARDKKKSIELIKKNPDILFKKVSKSYSQQYYNTNRCDDSEYGEHYGDSFGRRCSCEGWCCCEDEDCLVFFDLLIKHKTLTEKDFLDIDKYHNTIRLHQLNWREISKRVPLSSKVLLEKAELVDWAEISKPYSLYQYNKDAEFIKLFHKYLVWDDILCLSITKDEAHELVFCERIVPISKALVLGLLHIDDIKKYQLEVVPHIHHMLKQYNISDIDIVVEGLYMNHKEVYENSIKELEKHASRFLKNCTNEKYIPINYREVIYHALIYTDISGYEKGEFLKHCSPPEIFLEEVVQIVIDKMKYDRYKTSRVNLDIIDEISKISLSDEFISKFENLLKWKYILMSRQFDIETISRHLDEQTSSIISKYQKLPAEFIDKYNDSLDWFELCEHQELPEWLLRKHSDKLNWGQVSQYQRLSEFFITDYRNRINSNRYERNKHYLKS